MERRASGVPQSALEIPELEGLERWAVRRVWPDGNALDASGLTQKAHNHGNMTSRSLLLVSVLAAGPFLSGVPPAVAAHEHGTQATSPGPLEPSEASLERIQKKLMRDPAIKLDKQPPDSDRGLPRFRVQVDAPALTIDQILGPDFLRGPVPATGMTHQEFLDLVTPTDVRGYAAFTNKEGITVALTSTALRWALKSALEEWRSAKDEGAREAARKEVEETLAALRKARREAGLPDK